ncbi:unnamed protein product [Ixodes persulcatus]
MNIARSPNQGTRVKPISRSTQNRTPVAQTVPSSSWQLPPCPRVCTVSPTAVRPSHVSEGGDAGSIREASLRRRRSVDDALARVRETLLEVLEDSPAPLSAADGLFTTVFGDPGPSEARQQNTRRGTSEAVKCPPSICGTIPVIETLPEPRLRPGVEVGVEAGLDDQPRLDARRQLISDELDSIFERIETRWLDICARLRKDLGRKYGQFVNDCKSCLETESSDSTRQLLRREMAEARRDLLAEMEEEFRERCGAFDVWRRKYLNQELEASRVAAQEPYHVLATVLRYEILDSMPQLEELTRARAAQLWKEMMEQRELGDACLELEPLKYCGSSQREAGGNELDIK